MIEYILLLEGDALPVYPVDSLQFVWDIDFVVSASHWALEDVSRQFLSSSICFEWHLIYVDLNEISYHVLQVGVKN